MKFARLLVAAALLAASPALAGPVERGNKHYQAGRYDKAAEQWNGPAQKGDPHAQFNLGLLWMQGLGSTPINDHEAAEWFSRAAKQGHVPAMVELAKLQIKHSLVENAQGWLHFAARWGNEDAIGLLAQIGAAVPAPDLYNAQQQQIAAQNAAAEAARQQQAQIAQGQAAYMLGCVIAGGTGCYQHSLTASAWTASNAQSSQSSGTAVGAPSTNIGTRLCPNGQYVYGATCRLAPDGSYVGDDPRMAPDGTYVSGRPKMAPDGSYVGDRGTGTRMCPDGSYVAGSRCKLMPDGTYVGIN